MPFKSEKILPFSPPLGGPSVEEVSAAHALLKQHQEAVEQQCRDTMVKCTSHIATGDGCGAMLRVGDLTYIQTHWYRPPHGCTGGDYWSPGEGQFYCPNCGHQNRLYDSPEVEKLKPYFAKVENTND